MDLPLGVIGVAFGTVLLPTFAGFFSKGDVDGAREAFVSSSRQMLFVMIPAAVGLGVLAPEVTAVIYRGGAFDDVAVMRVSRSVAVYAAGLGFFGLQKSLVPWFQAQKDMKTPLRVSVWTVCLNAVLNILAVVLLPVEWRHVGLAGSTVFCAACGIVFLVTAARRRNGSLGLRRLAVPVLKMLAGSAVMTAAIFAVKRFTDLPPVPELAVFIAVGGIVYFASMAVLGVKRSRIRNATGVV
jgi:putative peptidoglycan lipid II flippase